MYFIQVLFSLVFLSSVIFVSSFPNVQFYNDRSIQETMVDILFCFARKHPRIMYKQVCSGQTL